MSYGFTLVLIFNDWKLFLRVEDGCLETLKAQLFITNVHCLGLCRIHNVFHMILADLFHLLLECFEILSYINWNGSIHFVGQFCALELVDLLKFLR